MHKTFLGSKTPIRFAKTDSNLRKQSLSIGFYFNCNNWIFKSNFNKTECKRMYPYPFNFRPFWKWFAKKNQHNECVYGQYRWWPWLKIVRQNNKFWSEQKMNFGRVNNVQRMENLRVADEKWKLLLSGGDSCITQQQQFQTKHYYKWLCLPKKKVFLYFINMWQKM